MQIVHHKSARSNRAAYLRFVRLGLRGFGVRCNHNRLARIVANLRYPCVGRKSQGVPAGYRHRAPHLATVREQLEQDAVGRMILADIAELYGEH